VSVEADELRRIAFDVGYRMLGGRAQADDIAQETLLRVTGPVQRGEIGNPAAFTTTVATRLAVDELRSARRRREYYPGPWLPEPIVELTDDPVDTADALSFALLVVLDTLSPLERAAFLLREVFAFDYGEIADALDRSEPACRKLVSRARRRVAEHRPDPVADRGAHRRLLERFVAAASGADVDGLVELLADDVRLVSDGGPDRKAARNPIVGQARVIRFLRSVFPRLLARGRIRMATVNGEPGFAVVLGDGGFHLVSVMEADDDGRIRRISWVLNPSKLPGPGPAPGRPAETGPGPDI
jgi:RNA polymerase sigma-70 factor (ECF subfamily)